MKWLNAKPGSNSLVVGLRSSEEEDKRLEELRQRFGVKSKGQVLRFALDLLEATMSATDVTEGQRKSTQETMDILRDYCGVATSEQAERLDAFRARRRARARRAREVAGRAARDMVSSLALDASDDPSSEPLPSA